MEKNRKLSKAQKSKLSMHEEGKKSLRRWKVWLSQEERTSNKIFMINHKYS